MLDCTHTARRCARSSPRLCAECFVDISHRRADAKYCSKRCTEHARINRNLSAERAKKHAYYLANKEKVAERSKKRYAQNKEQIKSHARAYYHRTKHLRYDARRVYRRGNKTHKTEYDRAYRQVNADILRIEKLVWKRGHAEEIRQRRRADYREFPEKYIAWSQQRRASRLSHPHSVGVSHRDWLRLLRRYNFSCAYCFACPNILHMEHVVPLSRGGRHAIGNILPACASCNFSKGTMFLIQWRIRKGRTRDPASARTNNTPRV